MLGNVYWLDENAFAVECNKNVLNMFGSNQVQNLKLFFEDMG